MHLLSEPVHLTSRVDEDHGLCDGQSLVQITQSVQLPFLYGTETREHAKERKEGRGVRKERKRKGGREGGREGEAHTSFSTWM